MQLAAAVILYEQVFQIEVSEGPCLLACLLARFSAECPVLHHCFDVDFVPLVS